MNWKPSSKSGFSKRPRHSVNCLRLDDQTTVMAIEDLDSVAVADVDARVEAESGHSHDLRLSL